MRSVTYGIPILILAVAIWMAPPASALDPEDLLRQDDPQANGSDAAVVHGERVGVGTPVLVPRGQVRRGDVVAVLAPATLEGDLDGDLVSVLGTLRISGRVDGDVVAVLSDVVLDDSAEIDGEFVQVLGSLQDAGASIRGEHVSVPNVALAPSLGGGFGSLVAVWLWFRAALLVAAFFGIFLLGALLPRWTLDGSDEITRRFWVALLVGAGLQVAALPLLVVLLILSIIGILLVPFVLLVYLTVLALGYAVAMHWVGERLARAAGRELSVLGALALGFLVCGGLFFVPVVGTLVWILAAWLGVGALALSRIGNEDRRAVAAPPGAATAVQSRVDGMA